jgi:hypothetical protein
MNQIALWFFFGGIFVCFAAWPIAFVASLCGKRWGQAFEWIVGLIIGHSPKQENSHDSSHRLFNVFLVAGLFITLVGVVLGLTSKI